jgi:hypothetical protein
MNKAHGLSLFTTDAFAFFFFFFAVVKFSIPSLIIFFVRSSSFLFCHFFLRYFLPDFVFNGSSF